jgi:hypothetical protein
MFRLLNARNVRAGKRDPMLDILMLGLGVVLFAVAMFYAAAAERI